MSLLERIVSELPVSAGLRQELTSPTVLRKHALYLRLPHLLAPAYPLVSPEQLEQLSVFGYFYFRFLVAFDQMLDQTASTTRPEEETERMIEFCSVYEAAIRGLCSLFPESAPFWAHLNRCKQQYAGSNRQEKRLAATRPPITATMFEELAAGKSAVCFAMVHALEELSGQPEHSSQLLACLRHVHIGLQCLDDVDDFVQDLANGQYTFAHYLTYQVYRAQAGADAPALAPHELELLFHSSRTAYALYGRAQHHFDLARQIGQDLRLPELTAVAGQLGMSARRQQHQASLHADIHAQRQLKSFHLFFPDRPCFTPSLIPGAVGRGKQQLSGSRSPQSRWVDLLTDQADTQYLVTAFAAALLSEGQDRHTALVVEASDSLFPIEQQPAGLLPGLSLGLGLSLQKICSGHQPDSAPRAWLDYQNADGGWVAYRDVPAVRRQLGGGEERDISGWTAAHACTTALNAWALRRFPACAGVYTASCAWLLSQQLPDGRWQAYWWSSEILSTAFAVLALQDNSVYRPAIERACAWLRNSQSLEGSWYVLGQPSAFYTALALQALTATPDAENLPAAEAAAAWLIGQQRTDGSWLASPLLRLPEPACGELTSETRWKVSPFGFNVLLADHNRVLTTAAACRALRAYHCWQVVQQAA
ncbi:terpene cyclase/mutase family protein [Hymenobacter sp. NST-14]|uniref:prenyltransferase/squalene oxidase repeat-containing protein n=1 Tax=Hymenobacter piscis TaxID=2839984 RepID=UPI001C0181E4|nr:prenyltransferase/squalene oxidase repeat-containing protein [Hymenobacter piscis]MBT9394350.1 terpene cyclase/mutase family protein [Hymenobacter piscis]